LSKTDTAPNPETPSARLLPPYAPRIVQETDDFLVVDKPPFMLVHPSKPSDTRTLWDELRGLLAYEIVNGGQVSIINRLDRETSGLTLIAKNLAAARELHKRMERHEIAKAYDAVVFGWPGRDEWTTDAPILRQGTLRESRVWVKQTVHPDGATAQTAFTVRERFEKNGARFALVRAFPKTGRMHQIRVHLAHEGTPIVGDKLYGVSEDCYMEFIETGWTTALEARLILPRQALHSAVLSTSEYRWECPLPPDLAAFAGT
jgi:23S rRNA pseudouridine1911/1915/1917 synthase